LLEYKCFDIIFKKFSNNFLPEKSSLKYQTPFDKVDYRKC